MLYFTGILLYLAVGAVAAPALQARETSDSGKPTSVVGSPGASSVQSSPAAGDQTGASSVQSSPAAGDQTGASSVQSSPTAGDQTGASSVQSSPAASDKTGASSVQSSPAASDQTGAAASAKPSLLSLGTSDSTDSTSTGSNQTLLYGPDSRPNITHLAVIEDGTLGSKNRDMFEAAGSILLALTKCNAEGNWIKSLFVNGTNEETNGNPNVTNVHVHPINNYTGPGYNITINRASMTNITSYGIKMDNIPAEPWWPWALIEAGLQAGWIPKSNGTEEDYNVQDLLKIFTGVNVTNTAPTKEFYSDVKDHLQSSPILVLQKDKKVYSVIMTPSADDSNDKYPLAGASTADTFQDDEHMSLEALGVKKVLYLDGYATLPQVEAKDKENNKTLPKSVESSLKDAKASAAESSKGESTKAGPTGTGAAGAESSMGESSKGESSKGESTKEEASKVESTGSPTQQASSLISSSPASSPAPAPSA